MKSWNELFPHWSSPVVVHPAIADVIGPGPRDEEELAFARFVDVLPKTEVHVHAEAAVSRNFYQSLGGDVPADPFTSFGDFLRRWLANVALFRRPEDYAALGRAFVADRAAQTIVETDCHFSPLDTSLFRPRIAPDLPVLPLGESITQFLAGLREGMASHPGVRVRAIADLLHIAGDSELDAAYAAIAPVVESPANRGPSGERVLVGIGLGGPERPDRAEYFAGALRRFRELGLALDLHSGEQTHVTPEAHQHAVATLRPDRVGHGFRGAPGFFWDGPIAACPLSNVLLRCHDGPLTTHPIAEMIRLGRNVSINTDDPFLLGTNLVIEYVTLRRAFGFDRDVVELTQKRARQQIFS